MSEVANTKRFFLLQKGNQSYANASTIKQSSIPLSVSTRTLNPPTNTTPHTRAYQGDKSILPGWKGTKPNPRRKITKHRKAKQQERPVLLDRVQARTQPAIRFEKGTETVTVHPVTCAVMPICWLGWFLAFPCIPLFSLFPSFVVHSTISIRFLSSLSIYPRVTPEAQWINWTKGTRGEKDGGCCVGRANALRTCPPDPRKNVIVKIIQDVSSSLSTLLFSLPVSWVLFFSYFPSAFSLCVGQCWSSTGSRR